MNEFDDQHERETRRRSAWFQSCDAVGWGDVFAVIGVLLAAMALPVGAAIAFLYYLAQSMNLLLPSETQAERETRVNAAHFLQYQRDYVDDHSRIKAVEKCRQSGLTYTEAFASHDETSKAGAKRDTWVSSRDTTQAKLFIDDAKLWARRHSIVARDMGEVVVDADHGFKAYQLDYPNGHSIYSMSSNPDAQAGKRGRRVADEFALHKDQRKLYAIMQPGLQWGGQMVFISTHRGTNSFFNREIVNPARDPATNKKKVSLHTITIQRAVMDGLWIKIKAQLERDDERYNFSDDDWLQSVRDECPDEETWLQEYCCVPADDASALLPWEDIIACSQTAKEREAFVIPAKARRAIGFDVARKKDLSVITTLAEVDGRAVVENVIVMERRKFSDQEKTLHDEMNRCSALTGTRAKLCIDASGLGMQLAERMTQVYGEATVASVMFTVNSKQELAFPLRGRFQDRTIAIPDDRLYTADLRSVKKQVTLANNIIITSEGGATDGHADRFWSLALANLGLTGTAGPVSFATVPRHTNTPDEFHDDTFMGRVRNGWNRLAKRR